MMTATSRILSVVILLVVLLAAIRYGEAIICYQCNSEYDPRCGDPFDPYTLGTVNCSLQPRLEHLSHIEPTLCRKLIYGKMRVVRGCGYVKDDEKDNNGSCSRKSGTYNVHVNYCSCTSDLCNLADNKSPAFGIVCTVIIFLAWKTI